MDQPTQPGGPHTERLNPDCLTTLDTFRAGAERDRLDVLGLGTDGRLVVAELKRDAAPQTVDMQAIKYAAMVSRFDLDRLADVHAAFASKHKEGVLTGEEAREALLTHTEFAITDETLRAPRIVLIAGSFPASTTATCVWLSEMGLDIVLVRVQAYRAGAEVVVTVSQMYPIPDVEEFVIAPSRPSHRFKGSRAPEVEWTPEDLAQLEVTVTNVTIQATMDLCAAEPGTWVASESVQARTGRAQNQHRGDYGGFGSTLKQRFGRSNPPFEMKWAAAGMNQAYYRLDPGAADAWREARRESPSAALQEQLTRHAADPGLLTDLDALAGDTLEDL